MPIHDPSHVYAQQLISCGLGLPLWQPEPPTFGIPEIGDAGFIQNGCFYRLFNALKPADDPLNSRGVPDGFELVNFDETEFIHPLCNSLPAGALYNNSSVHCDSQAGVEVNGLLQLSYCFTCYNKRAAMAVVADPATSTATLNNQSLPTYMANNYESWYNFASDRGHALRRGDIYLVRGHVRASNRWAIASCESSERGHRISFSAEALYFTSPRFNWSHTSSDNVGMRQRRGPGRAGSNVAEGPPPQVLDQTMFISYYKLKLRLWKFKHIVSGVNSKDSGGNDDDPSTGMLVRRHRTPPSNSASHDAHRNAETGSGSQRSNTSSASGKGKTKAKVYAFEGEPDSRIVDDGSEEEVQFYDPLDYLLDYILEHSDAQAAIASHDDLYTVCDLSNWPEDIAAHICQVQPKIYIGEGGLGQLFPPPEDGTGCMKPSEGSVKLQKTNKPSLDPKTVWNFIVAELDSELNQEDSFSFAGQSASHHASYYNLRIFIRAQARAATLPVARYLHERATAVHPGRQQALYAVWLGDDLPVSSRVTVIVCDHHAVDVAEKLECVYKTLCMFKSFGKWWAGCEERTSRGAIATPSQRHHPQAPPPYTNDSDPNSLPSGEALNTGSYRYNPPAQQSVGAQWQPVSPPAPDGAYASDPNLEAILAGLLPPPSHENSLAVISHVAPQYFPSGQILRQSAAAECGGF
ncbi:uncharacterized protein PHACADRAFT_193823 [Phanerochaete carnosa HHB-10118-sp]|uniref:Uncharacterized protein n=1 Tax=Phanerochaete carnosa (strain HHB-10118-sp) TaxID=650164 RepID=K5V7F5_PHACS|nr:uncharacterized protein PHACADRAFT_193823 [Phanerochaete carnosa HHB-10118-sp]EKM58706.1 hypothetical protein PHACADRAFT_193823 [Phanerochaete carnosa HHB-10118-sp]